MGYRAVVGLVLAGCGFHGSAGSDAPASAGGDGAHVDDAALTAEAAPAIDGAPDAPPDAPAVTPPSLSGDWLIPCTAHVLNQDYCSASDTSTTVLVSGIASQHWHATVHIRGVMANNTYQNGVAAAATGWYAGGSAQMSKYERFSLTVTSPPNVFYLNSGTPLTCCTHVFDYTAELDVDGGALLTFDSKSGDNFLWENMDSLTVTGVTTTPSPYDGQFAHLDLVSITPL